MPLQNTNQETETPPPETRASAGDAASRLGTERVGILLLKFSLPAITGMLVNALYNVVDRIFVGRGVNETALGGLSLVMPLMTLGMAFSMLVGIGSANLISMRLGQKRKADAEKALNHSFRLLIILGVLLMALGLIFIKPIIGLLGAQEGSGVLDYAERYFRIILFGMVPGLVGFGFSHCARAQGFPKISMTGMLIGAGANTILDPIFIFGFGWGVEGAAWATILSQTISSVYLLSFATSKRAVIRLKIRSFSFSPRITLDILTFGCSQFLLQLAMSAVQLVFNRFMGIYGAAGLGVPNGGDVALSAMTVVGSISMLILMPVFGINQGAQPVLGYNYGAKQYKRVFSAYTKALLAATTITTLGFIVIQVFAPQLVALFTPDGSEAMMSFAPWAMRTSMIVLPLNGCQIVTTNMFVVTGRPKISIFLAMLRQVILLIPGIIILSAIFGLRGVVYAMPIADAISVIVTITMGIFEIRKLRAG